MTLHGSEQLEIGAWRIDLASGSVTATDPALKINPKTQDLLLMLCRHANRDVSRDNILSEVWAGRVVEDATITNCIWLIRRGLGENGKEILQTRPKKGYRLTIPSTAWITVDPLLNSTTQTRNGHLTETAAPLPAQDMQGTQAQHRSLTGWPGKTKSIALTVLLFIVMTAAFLAQSYNNAPIVLSPDAEMTVTVDSPQSLLWLRDQLLKTAVENAYLRGSKVTLLQNEPSKLTFSGPHLNITIKPDRDGHIAAEISLRSDGHRLQKHFSGPPSALYNAFQSMMDQSLLPAARPRLASTNAIVSAHLAELRFERYEALSQYRKALALDIDNNDARIGEAKILFDLGKVKESKRIIAAIERNQTLTEQQDCRLNMLLAELAPEQVAPSACERARIATRLRDQELRELLRSASDLHRHPVGATQWLETQTAMIISLIRLGEFEHAEYALDDAQKIAQQAGWEYARITLEGGRGILEVHRDRIEIAASTYEDAAARMRSLGDIPTSVGYGLSAIRITSIIPGEKVTNSRSQLLTLIDDARKIGAIDYEIEASLILAKLNRDRYKDWHSDIARANTRIRETTLDGAQTIQPYVVLREAIGMHRYRETIQGVAALASISNPHSLAKEWDLTLRAQAHFLLDDLDQALAATEAMQRGGRQIMASANFCQLAWLSIEAGASSQAWELLKRCQAGQYDRATQATYSDYGLIALTRLHLYHQEPERAWPILKSRIETLLNTAGLTRQQAESLARLAQHAVTLPGADLSLLRRALISSETVAQRDGAGPTLRLETHLLRWRLCSFANTEACGPILPSWAQQDHLRARLAREDIAGQRPVTWPARIDAKPHLALH
jgi:DNA-binding winged helix-turn-helix (wHTH) protein